MTLDTLLEYLPRTVIITGLTTDLCVLFTASDAHMRDLHLVVPADCCAAASTEKHEMAPAPARAMIDIGENQVPTAYDSSASDFRETDWGDPLMPDPREGQTPVAKSGWPRARAGRYNPHHGIGA